MVSQITGRQQAFVTCPLRYPAEKPTLTIKLSYRTVVTVIPMTHFLRLILTLLLAAWMPVICRAQSPETTPTHTKEGSAYRLNVRGTVYEYQTLEPLPGASIKVYNDKDSLITGANTQQNGQYLLPNIPTGKYTVKVSFIGYKEQIFGLTLPQKNGNFRVSDVMMREDATIMKEAVVEGKLMEMTVVDDTVVYNADAFKLPEGSLVEDLIKKLPGVDTDENGNYTWNGKPITQILVDGKDFFGRNMNITLRNLPADIIDKVKAYERKSDLARITGIEDGNDRTVLDLAVKKNRKRGWFGHIEGGYGTSDRYTGRTMVNRFIGDTRYSAVGNLNNTEDDGMTERQSGGFNMNINQKELELNGSINGNFSQGGNERVSNSQSFENKRAAYSNSYNTNTNTNRNINFNYRVEWKPDSLTNILFRPELSYGSGNESSFRESASFRQNPYEAEGITHPLEQLDELDKAYKVNHRKNTNRNDSEDLNASASLQFNRRLKKAGRNLTVNLSGGLARGESNSESFSLTDYYQILAHNGSDSIYHKAQYNLANSKNHNLSTRLSYTEPIGDRMFLQMSYAYSYRFTDRDRTVSSIFDPYNDLYGVTHQNFPDFVSYAHPDLAQCNYTTNTYQNHNASLQLRINRTKYRLTVGANVQPQVNAVDYNKGGKHFDVSRAVVNASPNVNFRYNFSRQEQLEFRYNGSTGQPGITDLIPDTLSNADPLNIRLGNPELKPSFTQNINIDYRKSIVDLQRSYAASLQFHTTRNATSSRTEYNEETGGRVTRPENVNGNWNGHANFNFNTALTSEKRFHINTNTGADMTNATGYVYRSQTKETVKNRTRRLNLNQGLRLSYRNDWLEVNLNSNVRYNHSRSSNISASNLDTYRFHYGISTVMKLPWDMTFSTDLGEHSRRGYNDASMNTNELIWGFQISQRLLPKKNLTFTLRAVDLLNQREEVNRNISTTARTDTRTENIHSYFLFTTNYRFGRFGGRRGRDDSGAAEGRLAGRGNRTREAGDSNRSRGGRSGNGQPRSASGRR